MAPAREINAFQEFMADRQLLPHRQTYDAFLKLMALSAANALGVVALVLALISR